MQTDGGDCHAQGLRVRMSGDGPSTRHSTCACAMVLYPTLLVWFVCAWCMAGWTGHTTALHCVRANRPGGACAQTAWPQVLPVNLGERVRPCSIKVEAQAGCVVASAGYGCECGSPGRAVDGVCMFFSNRQQLLGLCIMVSVAGVFHLPSCGWDPPKMCMCLAATSVPKTPV